MRSTHKTITYEFTEEQLFEVIMGLRLMMRAEGDDDLTLALNVDLTAKFNAVATPMILDWKWREPHRGR